MSLGFDVRPSDTPLVDCVWRCLSSDVARLVSVSSSHWHLVVGEIEGLTEVTVHGPETHATKGLVPPDATWVGIRFQLGTVLQDLSVARLLDEYRICTTPVIKGSGEPLFRPASAGTVELLDTKAFATGAVIHAYRPTPAP